MKSNDEVIVKGFDIAIFRRLSTYVRPYAFIVTIAMIGLLVATVAELITPVIVQRTIDANVIPGYLLYHGGMGDSAPASRALAKKGSIPLDKAGTAWLIPHSNMGEMTGGEKKALIAGGQLSREEYYVLDRALLAEGPVETDASQLKVINAHPGLFSTLKDLAGEKAYDGYVIPTKDLSALSAEERTLIREQDRTGIIRSSWLFLTLIIASLLFTFLQVYLMAVTGQNVMRDIRIALLDHLIHQSMGFLQKTPVGSLVSRLTSDVDTINELFTSVAISFVKDFAIMAGVIVTLFFLNFRLAVITVCTMPPILVATLFFRVKAREVYRKVRLWVSRVNAFLSEHISGMDVVQMFGRERMSGEDFNGNNTGLMKAQLSEMYVFAVFRPLIDLFTSISTAVILYFGTSMFLELTVSLGVLFAFINLIQMFYRPVMDLSEKFTIMQSAMAGGERIFDILDHSSRIPSPERTATCEDIEGHITFDAVDFSYNEEEQILKGLSFDIKAGETIAIVGYTGAGKTTIANLLTRFWDIQRGTITIDGLPIKDISLDSLRCIIMPVQQDVFLFSGTVRENIALGSDIGDEDIVAAAKTVNAHDFIMALPDGYDTLIRERGSNLSTGQKQLISFARVIAHNPRIIILDEATGSIDTETEKLVQEALAALLKGRTSIVIAHRLSTIQHADRIFALSGGQLVESGNHDELLKKRGLYYNLYKLQYQQAG